MQLSSRSLGDQTVRLPCRLKRALQIHLRLSLNSIPCVDQAYWAGIVLHHDKQAVEFVLADRGRRRNSKRFDHERNRVGSIR